ncbi:nuclear transport factor 2 family protein [Conexibacter sp. JD483]|uniref:nuclear transport factor 2 family protein n=1 Tax=unclassified Conexibacter TaxID=2627773 RepID=UPI00271903D0|nr:MULTISPECIES: nuclear transport factor 2 family protein [unclassified Conexibacter]MDO8187837.1 nuclear transport factor 2 family protein [Conexibacter sp. CPCC 205706]MDO8199954.1 nuclear transport factor 2 family protein [Conexibacter sp. CPCC 205762]MDR9369481.1 nuclear transport factor 2 family protein [Conexibacter sp. JD483]
MTAPRPLPPADERGDELGRLLDERACERLIVVYAQLVDFGRASEIADLFTPDGRWEGTELLLEGREQIRTWFTRREQLARRLSRHVFTNVAVDVGADGPDTARALSYMVNYRRDRRDGDPAPPLPADLPKYVGECHDRFRRTHDGWRFASRRVEVAFRRGAR